MKYPSQILYDIAREVDAAEDWILERDWRVWEWPSKPMLVKTLAEEREARRQLVARHWKLRTLYEEKTGERPPDGEPVTSSQLSQTAITSFTDAINDIGWGRRHPG